MARRHGIDPAKMAIAFTLAQPFLTSSIVGATSMEQLKVNIDAAELRPSPELLAELDQVNERFPDPCP